MDPMSPARNRLHEIIFEADTPAGKAFDVGLLLAIVATVTAVMLESVESIATEYGSLLRSAEWVFTGLFTIEYGLRLYCVRNPLRYARSFFGIVDLVAVLPSYLALLFPGAHTLLVIRVLRLLRVFRVLKLVHFLSEASVLGRALRASLPKITVFLGSVVCVVVMVGTAMHLIERGQPGFDNIPESMYWAVVTLTTVGYGDVVPLTALGRILASMLMVLGYAIIAVPTGIVSSELVFHSHRKVSTQACPECMAEGHDSDAVHCKSCGAKL
jgi:voltage-gated potassium channel